MRRRRKHEARHRSDLKWTVSSFEIGSHLFEIIDDKKEIVTETTTEEVPLILGHNRQLRRPPIGRQMECHLATKPDWNFAGSGVASRPQCDLSPAHFLSHEGTPTPVDGVCVFLVQHDVFSGPAEISFRLFRNVHHHCF
jgi:hypothetical protein